MTILLVEDEIPISQRLQKCLEAEHFTVDVAFDGQEAVEKVEVHDYDVIILDIILPKMDGMTVCRKIREKNIDTPIIMLTAKNSVGDRIEGLYAGADDYLPKPFEFGELLARIRTILRREKIINFGVLQVGDLILDPVAHEVVRDGKEICLTQKEYQILDYMMRRPNRVCSRTMIGEHVWGHNYQYQKSNNLIETHIGSLRKKIDDGHDRKLIHTIFDFGYKIQDKSAVFDKYRQKVKTA
jgi:DNA-binding response OmpR family regulator